MARSRFLNAALLALALFGPAYAAPFDPSPYQRDLVALKSALAARYPNLDWALAERGLDMRQLAEDTRQALKDAADDDEARNALDKLVRAFGDGHMHLSWPDEREEPSALSGPAALCRDMGYEEEERAPGLPFERLGALPLGGADADLFPVHVLSLPGGKLGILRIPSFFEWGYARFCEAALGPAGQEAAAICDEDCAEETYTRTKSELTLALQRQIELLVAAAPDAVLVDLSGNGGGTLWFEAAARMLSAKRLRSGPMGLARVTLWREALQEELSLVEQDLSDPLKAIFYARSLSAAKTRLTEALAAVNAPCNRSGVWAGMKPSCLLVADGLRFTSGVMDYAEPGAYAPLASRAVLFAASAYPYREGVWSGPLYVLIDEDTASAAEAFAALLEENGAATLIGRPSFGAGCGWMARGDEPEILPGTGAELHVPDCVWYLKGGVNMVAGVQPALVVDWRVQDNPYQRARRTLERLQGLDLKTGAPRMTQDAASVPP